MPSLLWARNRVGRSIAEIVAADLDRDGEVVLERLRTADPAAWARLAFDTARLRDLLRAEAGAASQASPKAPARTKPARSRREKLARRLLAAVLADVEEHGPEAVAHLRATNVKAWCRLVSECAAFRLIGSPPAPQPRRQPRPVRMKLLLEAMAEEPVDPASGMLPMKQAAVLADAVAAVPREIWPAAVEVWKAAWGAVWDDALVGWLHTHLPGSIALPEDRTPAAGGRGKARVRGGGRRRVAR